MSLNPNDLAAEFAADAANVVTTDDKMGIIGGLANKQLEYQLLVEKISAELAAANEKLRLIQEVALPEAMLEAGLIKLTLANGALVNIKRSYACSISEARREEAIGWMVANGYSDLIKSEIMMKFGKGEADAIGALEANLVALGYTYTRKEAVHPSTLKSFVTKLMEDAQPFPQESFGVHAVIKAEIKPKK